MPYPPCPTLTTCELLPSTLANPTGTGLHPQPSWGAHGQQGHKLRPPSPNSPRLWVGEPHSAGRAVAGTHMHVGASRPAHAGWCACSWASMRLHISPNASQHPPPPVGCAPTPGAHTHPYALARPGLRLVPSLKQQPWGNAGTTGRVPLSTLIPPDSAHMVSWASPAPCSCIPKILRPRTGGSSLLPTPRAASWDQH